MATDDQPDNVYFSWTGCVPQSPWQPSAAFLTFLNRELCGHDFWNERQDKGWNSDSMTIVRKPAGPGKGKSFGKRKKPVLTERQKKYLMGQRFSKKDYVEMDLATSVAKKKKEKA